MRLHRLLSPQLQQVNISRGEFSLLCALLSSPQRTLTRDQLLELSRLHCTEVYDRSIDVQILRLRRKIELTRRVRISSAPNGALDISSPRLSKSCAEHRHRTIRLYCRGGWGVAATSAQHAMRRNSRESRWKGRRVPALRSLAQLKQRSRGPRGHRTRYPPGQRQDD